MKSYVMLCKKHIVANEKEFDTFFAYRQTIDKEGHFVDVLSPMVDENGKSIMKAKAIKVALSKCAYEKVASMDMPLLITLNDELKVDGKESYYVCVNKDKDKKPILDKKGRKHHLLVIRDFESATAVEKTSPTLENFEQFE